ncbi:trypco2 family protein [Streptomyces sp. NPDC051219]|uniref:trypco2 family protein n=1 Tax=Streptomyces sp. NPDC051219 TaxID=3155283 RepID=UPI003443B25A
MDQVSGGRVSVQTFGLNEVLQAMSRDLHTTQITAAGGGNVQLQVTEATIELSVAVEQGGPDFDGVSVKVLGLGVPDQPGCAVHRIQLKLTTAPSGARAVSAPGESGTEEAGRTGRAPAAAGKAPVRSTAAAEKNTAIVRKTTAKKTPAKKTTAKKTPAKKTARSRG